MLVNSKYFFCVCFKTSKNTLANKGYNITEDIFCGFYLTLKKVLLFILICVSSTHDTHTRTKDENQYI